MKYKTLNKTGEKISVLGQGTPGIFENDSSAFFDRSKKVNIKLSTDEIKRFYYQMVNGF